MRSHFVAKQIKKADLQDNTVFAKNKTVLSRVYDKSYLKTVYKAGSDKSIIIVKPVLAQD